MKKSSAIALLSSLLCGSVAQAYTPTFDGRYTDGQLTVEFSGPTEALVGTISLGGQTYPAHAKHNGTDSVAGMFDVGGTSYPFSAAVSDSGPIMIVDSGEKRYVLNRVADVPAAALAAATGPLAAYRPLATPGFADTLGATPHGQAWLIFAPNVTSAAAALKSSAKQLGSAFGDSLHVGSGYTNDKDNQGFAGFTASADGQAVTGKIVFIPATTNSFVAVLFGMAGTPSQEWDDLAKMVPTIPAMHPIALPGNCGTVAVPDGWKITGGDATVGSVVLAGPEGETVVQSMFLNFATPQNQVAQRIRNMPGSEPISPLLKPDAAMRFFIDLMNRQHGGAGTEILQMSAIPMNPPGPQMPQQTTQFITSTVRANGVVNRGMDWDQTWITGDGMTWTLALHGIGAPQDQFVHKLPMLLEIFNSYTVDGQVVAENTGKALKQITANAQLMHDRMDENFAASQKVIAEKEKVRHDGAMDTIEVIRGTRTVENTQIGVRGEADLTTVDRDVEQLNHDAGFDKFKAIPLRDQ